MSKHTPGPWELTTDGLGVCVALNSFLHPTEPRKLTESECEKEGVEPCDDYTIADCSDGLLARPSEECEANARLIAAAPELYRVVCMDRDKHLMGKAAFAKKYGIDWEKINDERLKAIAKAEGK